MLAKVYCPYLRLFGGSVSVVFLAALGFQLTKNSTGTF